MIGFIIAFILFYRFVLLNISIDVDRGALLLVAIIVELFLEIAVVLLCIYHIRHKKDSAGKIV